MYVFSSKTSYLTKWIKNKNKFKINLKTPNKLFASLAKKKQCSYSCALTLIGIDVTLNTYKKRFKYMLPNLNI